MIKVVSLKTRGCLGVIKYHNTSYDSDLDLYTPAERPLAVVNPKSADLTKQVDYAFTFEIGPSDYMVKDDGIYGISRFDDKNAFTNEFGNSQCFEVHNFDDLLKCLDDYLPERKYWNSRHRVALRTREVSFNKYFFDYSIPQNGSNLYGGLYERLGFTQDGTYDVVELERSVEG